MAGRRLPALARRGWFLAVLYVAALLLLCPARIGGEDFAGGFPAASTGAGDGLNSSAPVGSAATSPAPAGGANATEPGHAPRIAELRLELSALAARVDEALERQRAATRDLVALLSKQQALVQVGNGPPHHASLEFQPAPFAALQQHLQNRMLDINRAHAYVAVIIFEHVFVAPQTPRTVVVRHF